MRKSIWGLVSATLLLSCSGKSLQVGSNGGFGSPEVIVRDLLEPAANLVSDGTNLFWIDITGSDIWTVPVGGGSPRKIAGNAAGWAFFYVDATEIYYLAADGVDALPKTGGSPKNVLAAARVSVATASEGVVYWVENTSRAPPGVTTSALKSAPLAGGLPTTLAVFPGPSSWVAATVTPSDVALAENGNLTTVPLHGGTPRVINSTLDCQTLLGTAGGVYCAESLFLDDPPLLRVDSDGKTLEIARETANARSLAVDASNVYWANDANLGGGVVSAPRSGGKPTSFTHDPGCIAVAVDDAAVYWSEKNGTILRASK